MPGAKIWLSLCTFLCVFWCKIFETMGCNRIEHYVDFLVILLVHKFALRYLAPERLAFQVQYKKFTFLAAPQKFSGASWESRTVDIHICIWVFRISLGYFPRVHNFNKWTWDKILKFNLLLYAYIKKLLLEQPEFVPLSIIPGITPGRIFTIIPWSWLYGIEQNIVRNLWILFYVICLWEKVYIWTNVFIIVMVILYTFLLTGWNKSRSIQENTLVWLVL